MRFRAVVALAVMLAGLSLVGEGCSSTSADVTIKRFAFHPDHLVVRAGKTITVANRDTTLHTFTADDGSFNTESITPGTSRRVTFPKAGTFPYHCSIHVSITGVIQVKG